MMNNWVQARKKISKKAQKFENYFRYFSDALVPIIHYSIIQWLVKLRICFFTCISATRRAIRLTIGQMWSYILVKKLDFWR